MCACVAASALTFCWRRKIFKKRILKKVKVTVVVVVVVGSNRFLREIICHGKFVTNFVEKSEQAERTTGLTSGQL